MTADPRAARARRLNGLPRERRREGPLAKRITTDPWTWAGVVLTGVYALCLWWMYALVIRPIPVTDGEIPGMNDSALKEAAQLAWPTLLVWLVLYLLLDRYRPQRPLLWWLALGWGGAVSTAASLAINTWASQRMQIAGDGDPSQGARAAIFVAPFVEEATKASVLFLIAVAVRYELVSKVSGVVLGGLSAAGFAFTENILYYARVIVFSSTQIGAGDPEEALAQIVRLRGMFLAFGHPLFTMMTAIGVVVAVRTSSLVVRVLAPLVGYVVAALLHMVFNTVAGLLPTEQSTYLYFLVALPLVLAVVLWVFRQLFAQGRLVRDRLDDYVRMGWLAESDSYVFGRLRSRGRSLLVALTYGWAPFVSTLRLQQAMTELAYLRDAQARGTVDAAGDARAREVLDRIRALRATAVDDPRGKKMNLPKLRLRRRPALPPGADYPPPPGMPPRVAVPTGAAPLGSQQYSPVDPRWGPPKG